MLTNKQIARFIQGLRECRQDWLERLEHNGDSVAAAQHILSINSKIEFLTTLYNYSKPLDSAD